MSRWFFSVNVVSVTRLWKIELTIGKGYLKKNYNTLSLEQPFKHYIGAFSYKFYALKTRFNKATMFDIRSMK